MGSYRKDILLIAPRHHDLPNIDNEIAAVVGMHNVTLAYREADIQHIIRQRQRPDVIWVATHGNRDGILLADGVLLDGPALISYIASLQPDVVLLNACGSIHLGQAILSQTESDVIATTINGFDEGVLDEEAVRTAVLFSRNLANGMDYHEAIDRAKSPRFFYLINRHRLLQEVVGQQYKRLWNRIDVLAKQIDQIDAVVLQLHRNIEMFKVFWPVPWIMIGVGVLMVVWFGLWIMQIAPAEPPIPPRPMHEPF